ncbi:MAG TPA: MBOAT family protein [Pirellulaceae bacterium]|nr:MBOAT family protein [Pirellulaceae bacterium]
MTTIVHTLNNEVRRQFPAWLPLLTLPLATAWLTVASPAWLQLWSLAFAIYAGFKWLTFALSPAASHASFASSAGYLFLWTGMDADAFFSPDKQPSTPRWSEWGWSIAQMVFGSWLLLGLAPRFIESHPLIAAWLAMTGLVSVLHFGLSQLLSLAWRSRGVNARHIMHKPVYATSLADFWSHRWNLAFRDLMHKFVFQPLVQNIGVAWATMAVFLVSGLIHDAVISLAARGGWGLPTLYFLIQGLAVLVQRSRAGKRLGLGRGILGWLFAVIIVVAPAGLLFHPPFLRAVVVPMLQTIQAAMP